MHRILSMVALTAACAIATVSATEAQADSADRVALDKAVAAMCGKSIVILGEASHGDGHSDAVKVALVKRLVSRCGFNGVLFESSFYEFFPISQSVRQRKPVSPELIAAAVGGLWKFDREVQPLFGFLATQVDAGKVKMGGLDFQAGGFEQPYSNDVMFIELTSRLPTERRDFCRTLYHARAWGDDPPNGMTVVALVEALKSCLHDIGSDDGAAEGHPGARTDHQSQLMNLQAWLANDGVARQELVRSRDRMMAENASQFVDYLAKPAKVVIWTANGHAARDTSALGDYVNSDNLGAALSHRYGNKVFSMGVTACGGEYRWSPGTNKAITAPPAASLEARYCKKSDVSTFVGSKALKRADVCSSAMFGHSYKRAKWADAFDGVLVLNAEYAPHSTRP